MFKDLPGLYLDHKGQARNKPNEIKFESGYISYLIVFFMGSIMGRTCVFYSAF